MPPTRRRPTAGRPQHAAPRPPAPRPPAGTRLPYAGPYGPPPQTGGRLPYPRTGPRPAPRPDPRPVPGSRPRTGTRTRPRHRLARRIAGGLAVLVITASGLGHALMNGVNDAITRVDAFGGMQGRPAGSKGTNFLLVGTDSRDGIAPGERHKYHLGGMACHCTDTIMLVHLSRDRRRATVVSLPRDTYVTLPGPARAAVAAAARRRTGARTTAGSPAAAGPAPASTTHPAKLNEAYADGGPKLTVHAVEQLTGVHIDHYVEVDFGSFMKTVDVIGGVPVCTPKALKDPYSGLRLPAGTSLLNGGQALQYVRSRHVDGAADLGRMQRQQHFLAEVIHRITSGNTLRDPLELRRIATTALGSVRADQGLGAADLIGLAGGLKGFSPGSSEFVQVPLSAVAYHVPGIGSTVKWDREQAGRLWTSIRADRPLAERQPGGADVPGAPSTRPAVASAPPVGPSAGPAGPSVGPAAGSPSGTAPGPSSGRSPVGASVPPDLAAPGGGTAAGPAPVHVDVPPAQVRVVVENGTDTSGLAATAQRQLAASGFVTPGLPTNSAERTQRTLIRYDPRWDRSARSLAAALPGAQLVAVPGQGPVMNVTLGSDFTRVTPVTSVGAVATPAGTAVSGDQEVTCR